MTLETKTAVLDVVEYAAERLNISKGSTYNAIVEVLESNMQEIHTRPRVHSGPPESLCTACEG